MAALTPCPPSPHLQACSLPLQRVTLLVLYMLHASQVLELRRAAASKHVPRGTTRQANSQDESSTRRAGATISHRRAHDIASRLEDEADEQLTRGSATMIALVFGAAFLVSGTKVPPSAQPCPDLILALALACLGLCLPCFA